MTRFDCYLLALLLMITALGCDRFNSELEIPQKPVILVEKPTCSFKAGNNCWVKSVSVLWACVEPGLSAEPDFFTEDRKNCYNNSGKLIQFANPDDLQPGAHKSHDGQFDFLIYSKGKECFEIRGHGDNFSLTSSFGTLSYSKNDQGDIQVQCFGGEKLNFSADVIENGCANIAAQKENYLPGVAFEPLKIGSKVAWSFSFRGLGENAYIPFQCR